LAVPSQQTTTVFGASAGRPSAPLSTVWTAVRIIFGVHIDIGDAALPPGMIGRCVSDIVQESYPDELFQLHAAPVGR
jgi:hypothetical protein